MGGVKAMRAFRGAPLVAHALAQARRWSDRVVVVVRAADQVAGAVDAPLAFDQADVPGPLAGLAAALAYARAQGAAQVLVIPCDMPRLPEDLRSRLEAGLGPGDGCALPVAAGGLQPVCGLWRASVLTDLPGFLASGQSSLRGFAAACGLAQVCFGDDEAFANANTPDELDGLARAPL
jgi:molybdopterin-guanine dinucleotide biosynthesis protein A